MKEIITFRVLIKPRIDLIALGCLDVEDNDFYLNKISNKTITVDSFCQEENVFTCIENKEYKIPYDYISRLNNASNKELTSYVEIKEKLNFFNSPEAARQTLMTALKNMKLLISYRSKENQQDFLY